MTIHPDVRCIQTESHSPGSKSEQLQVMYKIYSDKFKCPKQKNLKAKIVKHFDIRLKYFWPMKK